MLSLNADRHRQKRNRVNLPAESAGASRLTKQGWRATDAPMIMTFLQVGLGGAIGAMLRFGTGMAMLRLTGPGFPLGVLSVNVVGSFLMGVFVVYAFHRDVQYLNPFVMSGILGGFTTFSAFSLEAFTLYERGEVTQAAAYVALSVVLSIGALILGIFLARSAWA